MLDRNPYARKLADALQKAEESQSKRLRWSDELAWFRAFDLQENHTSLSQSARRAKSLREQVDEVDGRLGEQQIILHGLEARASIGIDPRYWFSSARAVAKRQVEEAKKIVEPLLSQHAALQTELKLCAAKVDKAQANLNRYRAFDPLQAEAAVRSIDAQQEGAAFEIARLTQSKELLADQIRGPLSELEAEQREERLVLSKIEKAEKLDRQLTNESNPRERAMIHQQCAHEFQESSPGKVIKSLRYKLQPIQRRIQKIQSSIDIIVERSTRVVRTVVIDGLNMCYQQHKFIGLVALAALAPHLSERYKVIIVFDSDIRGLLRMRDRDIKSHFDSVIDVHVVSTTTKADETVLAIAETDKTMYVLSNDRFHDFIGRRAVADGRLMRHEIVNDIVHVHALDLSVGFSIAAAER